MYIPVNKFFISCIMLAIYLLLPSNILIGQSVWKDDLLPSTTKATIEEYIESLEDSSFDIQEFYEFLSTLYRNKLDINSASLEEMQNLLLLNDLQVNSLYQYRLKVGLLDNIFELQAVPNFDLNSIERILPFIEIGGADNFVNIKETVQEADFQILWRSFRFIEELKGETKDNGFLGDPFSHFFRISGTNGKKFRFNFQGEKDIGEQFFNGNNKQGFDSYSAGVGVSEVSRLIKSIYLGDMYLNIGQGLIFGNSAFANYSSAVLNIKKNRRPLNVYRSLDEGKYIRGIGSEFRLNERFSITSFASYKKQDARLTFLNDSNTEGFFSIDASGLHRSSSEIDKENTIGLFSTGSILTFSNSNLSLSLNTMYNSFNKPFSGGSNLYELFEPNKRDFLHYSLDFDFFVKNFNFYGEVAKFHSGGSATLLGLLAVLDSKLSASIMFRNYDVDYFSLQPNGIGQTSSNSNERGIYLGLEFNLNRYWRIITYADFWKHPWLRFRIDAPSHGSEYLFKINYYRKRNYNIYLLARVENKFLNPTDPTPIDKPSEQNLYKFRFQLNKEFGGNLQLKSRAEFSYYKLVDYSSRGFLVFQDVTYNNSISNISLASRIAYFNIDDFNARIYTYESDVRFDYSAPFFSSGTGLRYYVKARYRFLNSSIEIRLARTQFFNRNSVSSGLNEIEGQTQTEVKLQFIQKL